MKEAVAAEATEAAAAEVADLTEVATTVERAGTLPENVKNSVKVAEAEVVEATEAAAEVVEEETGSATTAATADTSRVIVRLEAALTVKAEAAAVGVESATTVADPATSLATAPRHAMTTPGAATTARRLATSHAIAPAPVKRCCIFNGGPSLSVTTHLFPSLKSVLFHIVTYLLHV
jgi:hypothetical protein